MTRYVQNRTAYVQNRSVYFGGRIDYRINAARQRDSGVGERCLFVFFSLLSGNKFYERIVIVTKFSSFKLLSIIYVACDLG